MSLNLVHDRWIPVRLANGQKRLIAPHEMADPEIAAPDWPRADLNLACYELLIGLVRLAAPPSDLRDWMRNPPTAADLKARLEPYAEGFALLGEGPRFMQDLEDLPGAPSGPDLLFIDSSGANTAKNNADLMVHRDRYQALDLPLAAMALYAFQQFAPSGGAGNRTSMRGGGPLVTLADPGKGLWALVWANVPYGAPAALTDLSWMRPTRTSEGSTVVHEADAHPIEAFFGMPRRLRLVGDEAVTGIVQRPFGTNYGLWRHPLSPYYRMKEGAELLPRHPATGRLPYRNWIGIVLSDPQRESGLRLRAQAVQTFAERHETQAKRMIAAGWAMDNMKPKDFLWAELPLLDIDPGAEALAEDLIEAAAMVAAALRMQLPVILAEGSARDAQLDRFWQETEGDFTRALAELAEADCDAEALARRFLAAISRQARRQFEALAVPGLAEGKIDRAGKIVTAHRYLNTFLAGRSKSGRKLWDRLGLEPAAPKAEPNEEIPA